MELVFDTIGNAIVIAYDKAPILVTYPWVKGFLYFGSWKSLYEIPTKQLNKINNNKFILLCGHPIHLEILAD